MKFWARQPWRVALPWPQELLILLSGASAYLLFPVVLWALCSATGDNFRLAVMGINGLAMLVTSGLMLGGMALTAPLGALPDKLGLKMWTREDVATWALAVVLMPLGSALLTWLWTKLLDVCGVEYEKVQLLMQFAAEATGAELAVLLLMAGLIVPIAEELFFRRLLFGLWRRLGAAVGWGATALCFAGAHGFLAGVPGLVFMGLFFQYLYVRSGNLTVSMAAHAAGNILVILLAFFTGNPEL